MSVESSHVTCPACGGAGGGPFGRAGSAWDDEEYVCPRCQGRGWITLEELATRPSPASQRPGIAKAVPDEAASPDARPQPAKKKASA
jgi:hypothetical protein